MWRRVLRQVPYPTRSHTRRQPSSPTTIEQEIDLNKKNCLRKQNRYSSGQYITLISNPTPPPWYDSPSWLGSPHYRGFMIELRHTTFGRTPLDEWSARRRDLYLTQNTHNRRTDISCPRRDSNPRFRLMNSRRPTPWTTRPLGSFIRSDGSIQESSTMT